MSEGRSEGENASLGGGGGHAGSVASVASGRPALQCGESTIGPLLRPGYSR